MARATAIVNRARAALARAAATGRPLATPRLEAERDLATLPGGAWLSTSREPWLLLDLAGGWPAGRWIRLRYRTGLLADPVRPVLRIRRKGGRHEDRVLPGPVCGGAIWVGKLPPDTVSLSLSPVASPGPFAFAVDGVAILSRPRLLAGAFARRPLDALDLLWQRIRGKKLRARHLLAAIWASIPGSDYRAWLHDRESRQALPEPAPERAPPTIGILIEATGAAPGALACTLASLDAQAGGPWPRRVVEHGQVPDLGCDYIGSLAAGDLLAPHALAAAAAALARATAGDGARGQASPQGGEVESARKRRPGEGDAPSPERSQPPHRALSPSQRGSSGAARGNEVDLLYSDEDRIGPDGLRREPILQPDWSPRLHRTHLAPRGLILVRAGLVARLPGDGTLSDRLRDAALAQADPEVVHLRRIALHRAGPEPAGLRAPPARARSAARPSVSAVIPSRDRVDLLARCVEGLRVGTDGPPAEIVIVDNGSEAPATHAYYRSLAGAPGLSILERPGPFNYSALTNAGAEAATGEMLLLLNNDMEVVHRDWLDLLLAEAEAPGTGAIGPKLLYPDGRVQHAGVVIGLGGAAAHIYRGRADQGPGWSASLSATHEVSAVTGACILLRRADYAAVGGLDAEHLPVSFNDIDLCLKLRAAGLRNLLVPESVLVHHESASRGLDLSPAKQERAARESAIFAERWLHVMRDDPYWHPGLSLMRFDPCLG